MAWILSALAGALTIACGDDPDNGTAVAQIMPTMGNTVTGTATFTKTDGHVSLTVTVSMATAGMHGMHIHQEPMCGTDGMAAGGHWNGMEMAGGSGDHGLPTGATHHLGDLGNITVAGDGTGTLTIDNHAWKLGDGSMADVVDHSIIFHASPDDGMMPSAGARQGCGVIAMQ